MYKVRRLYYWRTSIERSVVTTVTGSPTNEPFQFTPTAVSTPPCICNAPTQRKDSAYVSRCWHCHIITVFLEVTNTGPFGYQELLCTRHQSLWKIQAHFELSRVALPAKDAPTAAFLDHMSSGWRSFLKMEAIRSFETSEIYYPKRPEN